MLADAGAKVARFQMFVVGEGIEKKVVDFAAGSSCCCQGVAWKTPSSNAFWLLSGP